MQVRILRNFRSVAGGAVKENGTKGVSNERVENDQKHLK